MRGEALTVSGQLEEAHQVLHGLLGRLSMDAVRSRVVGLCATVDRLLGRHAEARALLLQELARQASTDGPQIADLKLELALGRFLRRDSAAEPDWAQQALDSARQLSDQAQLATALTTCLMNTIVYHGAPADRPRAALLDEAVAAVDGLMDGELATRLEAAVWLGWSEVYLGRLDDALRHLDRGLRVARATSHTYVETYLLIGLCVVHRRLGRLPAAASCIDAALAAATATGSDELRTAALTQRCWLQTWTGDIDVAVRIGGEAVQATGTTVGWFSATAYGVLAQATFYGGNPARCSALLMEAGAGPTLPRFDPMSRPALLELLAAAQAECGQDAERSALAAEELAAHGPELRTGFAELTRCHALRALDPVAAAAHARLAAQWFIEAEDRLNACRAFLAAASALGSCGEVDRASNLLDQARLLADQCQVPLLHELTETMDKRLAGRSHVDSVRLTIREQEVLTLLADSMTAEAIARRLGISPRTVHRHLQNLYRKLGATNRLAAVLSAQTLGLLPDTSR
jgi:DNA-binding CsgD family transcriptional regulator/tetratricopeptide (TPR) repeat protein